MESEELRQSKGTITFRASGLKERAAVVNGGYMVAAAALLASLALGGVMAFGGAIALLGLLAARWQIAFSLRKKEVELHWNHHWISLRRDGATIGSVAWKDIAYAHQVDDFSTEHPPGRLEVVDVAGETRMTIPMLALSRSEQRTLWAVLLYHMRLAGNYPRQSNVAERIRARNSIATFFEAVLIPVGVLVGLGFIRQGQWFIIPFLLSFGRLFHPQEWVATQKILRRKGIDLDLQNVFVESYLFGETPIPNWGAKFAFKSVGRLKSYLVRERKKEMSKCIVASLLFVGCAVILILGLPGEIFFVSATGIWMMIGITAFVRFSDLRAAIDKVGHVYQRALITGRTHILNDALESTDNFFPGSLLRDPVIRSQIVEIASEPVAESPSGSL